MRWGQIAAAAASVGCAGLISCATAPDRFSQQVTWNEAVPVEQSAPPARSPTTEPLAPDPAPVRAVVPVGLRIDRALAVFHSRRAVAKSLPRSSPQHAAAWVDVLGAIDAACLDPPSAADLGAFVRARVTLEVELDSDLRRGVRVPEDLATRVKNTLAYVDQGVHSLRMAQAPGTLAPVPRLRDGQLVLRAPVAPMMVSSPFGVRWDPIDATRRFHAGVDVSAPEGTMIYASASGVVVYAGWQGGFGKHVVLDHGDGLRTHYSHMAELFVKPGQLVAAEDTIGSVGSTGRSTGPHLHFAVTTADGQFRDPMTMLDVPLDQESGTPRVATLSTQSVDFQKIEAPAPISDANRSIPAGSGRSRRSPSSPRSR